VFDSLPLASGPEDLSGWSADGLVNSRLVESTITEITVTPQTETYIINNNQRFSVTEDLLIVRDGKYLLTSISDIKNDDKLVTYDQDGDASLVNIFSKELVEEETIVYDYIRSPHGLIVADGILAYNAYPTK